MADEDADDGTGRPDRERRYTAPALEKGLDILELLSASREALTLQQIGDGVGRTKGEIFRMVSVLQDRLYIERTESEDRFRVTDRLFRLGLNRPVNRSLVETALPFMNAFSDATGYACHLAVPSETQMVVIARVESTSHIGFTVRIGYRQPLTLTGSGRCLLAFMSARRRHRTLLDIHREDPAFDLDALEPELSAIRASGHVARPSGLSEAVMDLSVPVSEAHEGGAIAALTCPYLRIRLNPWEPDALIAELAQAAGRIGQGLALQQD
ncbi:IclR family transcriptional regulator [Aureimonas ureilytica]|uniref:IclR family transcriptional regulator n=1 Tax=Aureimonas ureilytica TaxID=401562 RepID=UPI003CEE87D1